MIAVISFVKSIGLRVWGYVAGGALVMYLLYRIYKAGGDAKETENLNRALKAVMRRNKVEKTVDELSDDDVLNKLRDNNWTRRD
jgi:hypothetical protein